MAFSARVFQRDIKSQLRGSKASSRTQNVEMDFKLSVLVVVVLAIVGVAQSGSSAKEMAIVPLSDGSIDQS